MSRVAIWNKINPLFEHPWSFGGAFRPQAKKKLWLGPSSKYESGAWNFQVVIILHLILFFSTHSKSVLKIALALALTLWEQIFYYFARL